MPEASIPGMAFRARLSKKSGANVIELIFRGDSITTVDISGDVTDASIRSALKLACTEADIEHQITEAALSQVAGDLYKQAGLGEGKVLLPQEFELGGEATELDRKLAIIISSLQKLHTRLDKIESLLEISSEE
ncbi:MAG: hypothetical protein JSU57_01860 [Candidatus Heimdallarchaeota archaeon]|nr:MAG: hypothetical protein JSU57_01860 [Candidatus Heimdallarchaeota archaeon]